MLLKVQKMPSTEPPTSENLNTPADENSEMTVTAHPRKDKKVKPSISAVTQDDEGEEIKKEEADLERSFLALCTVNFSEILSPLL